LAEETAQRAAALNPENPQEHILAAYTLQEHGLFDWAEREYRQILQRGPAGSPEDLRTRFLLSEMLHDLQRELEAAQVLQGASDVLDKDQNAVHQIARLGRDPGGMRSRMHYFYAEHQRLQGNSPKQREHLQEAVKHDNTDADVLIAMYRVADSDPAWKEMTANLIRDAAAEFRAEIRAGEQQAAAAPNDEIRELYNRQLAQSHNQLAWLLSNTTGDYDEALRSSLRSLDLHPKSAGYLDTLGRCYYAKGDYENAVRTQAEAVELEPHSCQIRRQLELFQAALNKP
jgi:Flp pilus assembly protein TadD